MGIGLQRLFICLASSAATASGEVLLHRADSPCLRSPWVLWMRSRNLNIYLSCDTSMRTGTEATTTSAGFSQCEGPRATSSNTPGTIVRFNLLDTGVETLDQ